MSNSQPMGDCVVSEASLGKRIATWAEHLIDGGKVLLLCGWKKGSITAIGQRLCTPGGLRIVRSGRREDVHSNSLRCRLLLVGAMTRPALRQRGTGHPCHGDLLRNAFSLDG